MSSVSEEQLRKEFNRIDKNKDGIISLQELKDYYVPMQEMLGVSPFVAEQEIIGLIKRLDVDNSGTVSFDGIEFHFLFVAHLNTLCLFRIQTIPFEIIETL